MIQPSRVSDVCEVLLVLDIANLTVTEAQEFGRQNGHTTFYPDTGQSINLSSKAKNEGLIDTSFLGTFGPDSAG